MKPPREARREAALRKQFGMPARYITAKMQRQKPLRRQSKGRAADMRHYYQERREWLARPSNGVCAVCLCLGQPPRQATEVHHSRGRVGRLLRDQRFWVPSCFECRMVPHDRPKWAREMGLLCEVACWNVYPQQ